MVTSVSTTPSYYSLLGPSSSSGDKTPSVLDAISSVINAAQIGEDTAKEINDAVKLSPEVKALLDQLNGGGTGIPGALLGGTPNNSSNLILKAASKAALRQAYASISAMAYNAATNKVTAEAIASNPMDTVISAYRKALSGAAATGTTTEA